MMKRFFSLIDGSAVAKKALSIIGYIATAFSVFVFAFLFLHFLSLSAFALFGFLITLGVPFLAVSIVRWLINAPRPYEMPDFAGQPPKKKGGCSFPSRHAFSIFAIGTLCLFVNLPLGLVTLIFGAVMCFSRVALRLHFVRDVASGALVGIISSVIGAFILL